MAWQPGESGNPTGRGKQEKPWRDALNVALKDGDGQALRRIAEKVVARAEAGEMDAITEIGNRLDGKPKQSMDLDAVISAPPLIQEIPDPPKNER